MDVDEALEAANPLGRTQVLTIFVTILAHVQLGFLALTVSFNAETPPHHCKLQHGKTLNESIPVTDDGIYSSCEEFVNKTVGVETRSCSKGWDYDTKLTGESITSEWDLVCSQDILPELSQTFLFIGFSLGSLVGGPMADKYGRKLPTLFSLVLFNAAGIALAFSPNYATFAALRFLMGFMWKIPLFTMLIENLVPRHRPSWGNVPPTAYAPGLVAMAGIAYLVRDWRMFSIIMMIPSILMMLTFWLLPESLRWLVSRGELEKAKSTLQTIAKFNRVDLPHFALTSKSSNSPVNGSDVAVSSNETQHHDGNTTQEVNKTDKNQSSSPIQLFKTPTRTVTIVISWCWLSFTLGYFGFALTTGILAGDPYLNFLLSGLVELPARTLPVFMVKKTGNLLPVLFGFGSTGFVMIGVVVLRFLIDQSENHGLEWLLTTLALLGKFFCASIFVPLLLCTSELFPTSIRNSGAGFTQLIGNIGSLSSPLLIYMDKYLFNLPFIITASFALIASVLCIFLPETLNTTQPETPDDLQKLFETKLFLKSVKSTFQSMSGERKYNVSQMAANPKEGVPDSEHGENLGYESS